MRHLYPEQHDTGTRLAMPTRRRPFSECNKGNRRRLHAGYKYRDVIRRNKLLKGLTKLSEIFVEVPAIPHNSSAHYHHQWG